MTTRASGPASAGIRSRRGCHMADFPGYAGGARSWPCPIFARLAALHTMWMPRPCTWNEHERGIHAPHDPVLMRRMWRMSVSAGAPPADHETQPGPAIKQVLNGNMWL